MADDSTQVVEVNGNGHSKGRPDQARIQQALRESVQHALRMHKFMGVPIVTWKDGKVVEIPPPRRSWLMICPGLSNGLKIKSTHLRDTTHVRGKRPELPLSLRVGCGG